MNDARLRAPQAACAESENWTVLRPSGSDRVYENDSTLQQYVGRLHRLHDGKRVVQVYDYVDPIVAMLARMYQRRLRGYSIIGTNVAPPERTDVESSHSNKLFHCRFLGRAVSPPRAVPIPET